MNVEPQKGRTKTTCPVTGSCIGLQVRYREGSLLIWFTVSVTPGGLLVSHHLQAKFAGSLVERQVEVLHLTLVGVYQTRTGGKRLVAQDLKDLVSSGRRLRPPKRFRVRV